MSNRTPARIYVAMFPQEHIFLLMSDNATAGPVPERGGKQQKIWKMQIYAVPNFQLLKSVQMCLPAMTSVNHNVCNMDVFVVSLHLWQLRGPYLIKTIITTFPPNSSWITLV